MADTAHKTAEEIRETEENEETIEAKALQLSEAIRKAKHFVIFVGAGISTSAGIPDFRGPQGVWTLRDQGKQRTAPTVSSLKAVPTPTHMAIVELVKRGICKFVISQNTDGLLRKSGVIPEKLAELHGNTNIEKCTKCGRKYLRDTRVRTAAKVHDHITGRKCDVPTCKGDLIDTIINFGENLPEKELEDGFAHTAISDLCLVLGSSLRVTPAADMPHSVVSNKVNRKSSGPVLYIANLQGTPLDNEIKTMKMNTKCDTLMLKVMRNLGIPIPEWRLERRIRWAYQKVKDNGHGEKTVLGIGAISYDDIPMTLFSRVELFKHTKQSTSTSNETNNNNNHNSVLETFSLSGTPIILTPSDTYVHGKQTSESESKKDPFNFRIEKSGQYIIRLHFMGHYNEPAYEFLVNVDCKADKVSGLIEIDLDVQNRVWYNRSYPSSASASTSTTSTTDKVTESVLDRLTNYFTQ